MLLCYTSFDISRTNKTPGGAWSTGPIWEGAASGAGHVRATVNLNDVHRTPYADGNQPAPSDAGLLDHASWEAVFSREDGAHDAPGGDDEEAGQVSPRNRQTWWAYKRSSSLPRRQWTGFCTTTVDRDARTTAAEDGCGKGPDGDQPAGEPGIGYGVTTNI